MMQKLFWRVSALVVMGSLAVLSCKNKKGPPDGIPSEFGLDTRPANPTCLATDRPSTGAAVTLAPAFDGLTFQYPIGMQQRPGDDTKWYVIEQNGILQEFANDPGVTVMTPYIDVSSRTIFNEGTNDERGLLGFAFHPNFAANGYLFLSYYTNGTAFDRLSRYTMVPGNTNVQTLATESIRASISDPYTNHNGGDIHFGQDGYLYWGTGDGGLANDPGENGQDRRELLGKMLRIDVNVGATYGIPADNPFVGDPDPLVKGEIWAYGFRNPWRWSFDQGNGELWVGDVGQDSWEEVDRVEKGGNYGWDDIEGSHCFEDPTPCTGGGRIEPMTDYSNPGEGVSITGGYVYRGTAIPQLVGTYIFGDFGSGTIWGLSFDPISGDPVRDVLIDSGKEIASFAQGNDGEVYVVSRGDGKLLKIVPTGAPAPDNFPKKLSLTGCVDPLDPKIPSSGLIPYDVNVPLWSDGSEKHRWLALPDGQQISINAEGDFDLPIGSVLMKEFRIGAKRIETRLFMRHADGGWAGYTYEWNDTETEADLLPAGKSRIVGTQEWKYPSRAECLQCHTVAAGRTLGLEIGQLNRTFHYPNDRVANQMATFDHIGLFNAALPALTTIPAPDGAMPLDMRARAYLHGNCAYCHRPGGTGQGTGDYLYTTLEMQMNLCNADPQEGDLGVTGAKLIVPGNAGLSLVSLRMHAEDSNRMPDTGTLIMDPEGTQLIDAWINSLTSCP